MSANRLSQQKPTCVTYISVPHLGYGFVQTCVSLLENFPTDLLAPKLVLPRAFQPIASSVDVVEAVPRPFPYRFAAPLIDPALDFFYKRALAAADPENTIAYFWPNAGASLVRHARERGFLTVREMINTARTTAKPILDEAYRRQGLEPSHGISEALVESERDELAFYDYILASNPLVEKSLLAAGIAPARIVRTSFGWTPSRFAQSRPDEAKAGFRAVFVGGLCVRKGTPQLLAAWRKSGVSGELLLVGGMEAAVEPLIRQYDGKDGVRCAGFVTDVGRFYKAADVFIFPTFEEGGPQVTIEAAGCGLPVITTPMGCANIIQDGRNGLVVDPYDVDGLARAIAHLANSPDLRRQMGEQAARDAQAFTYERLGAERGRILHRLLATRSLAPAGSA